MTSLKSFNRRVGSLFSVAALALATVTPGLIPAFASAAQVTERSVELSSSSKLAEDVTYNVGFTSVGAAGAVVFEFCSNSPLIGEDCTAPGGFDVSGAETSVDGFTENATTAGGDNVIELTGTIGAAAPIEIDLAGVTNPTAAGPLYLRIVTYNNETNALDYESDDLGTGVIDQGSAAISITDSVGVSGAVLESMTFCVSAAALVADNCAGATPPVLKLGEGSEDVFALSSTVVSEGDIFSQISTNAASGAVVNLKSSATDCGGLVRAGAPESCDIAPALATGITGGQPKFGVKVAVADPPNGGANTNGTFRAYSDTPYYSDSIFKLNFVEENATGITSPYGDPFLDTDGEPVNNKNVKITFGASVANNTPAGIYSTDLSLIATGKF